jgi:hypothetical protein
MHRLTLVKEFTYRGKPEEWSNTYHFTGVIPGTDAEWRALAVAVMNSEKTCYASTSKLVTAYGYTGAVVASVYQGDFRVGSDALIPGTLAALSSDNIMAGDQAGWLRGHIGVSISGKKVYVRKYFHGGYTTGGAPDSLTQATKDAYTAHGQILKGGTLPGPSTWCAPDSGGIGLTGVSQFVTTRTLKRRGKRPTAP